MDSQKELTALRSIREVNIAIRELESQAAETARLYKKGVKQLLSHILSIESFLDDGGVIIEGTEPWNMQSDQIKSLIDNPVLSNIEQDLL